MKFRVPQFIDMEDKIFGPLTLKQFAYVLGAGGFSFLIWTFISIKVIAFILIVPIAGMFIALAFAKINGRPFADTLESAFKYYSNPKIYTWKQPQKDNSPNTMSSEKSVEAVTREATKEALANKVDANKLHDISLGLDVLDRDNQ